MQRKGLTLTAALCAIALTACGTQTAKTVTQTVTVTKTVAAASTSGTVHFTMPPSQRPTSCSLYVYGHDVQVLVESNSLEVNPACRSIADVQSSGGVIWQWEQGLPAHNPTGDGWVCQLQGSQGRVMLGVLDDGTADLGSALCSAMISAGWTEQPQQQ